MADPQPIQEISGIRLALNIAERKALGAATKLRANNADPRQIALVDASGASADLADMQILAAANWQPPASTGYTVEDLILGSTGPHAGTICGVAGYDWEHHGVIQSSSPGGRNAMTAWGVANWDCGQQAPGVGFELRNPKGYALTPGGWVPLTDEVNWVATMNPETNQFTGPNVGNGPSFAMPYGAYSVHFGSAEHASLPAGTIGVVSLFQARQLSGPVGRLMIGSGADYWSGSGNVGAVVGQYRFLTMEWAQYGAASISAQALRDAGLPPL